eukprot:Skav222143  [mRNA]  locus=scaffold1181:1131433:1142619:- [translate_table: standard]
MCHAWRSTVLTAHHHELTIQSSPRVTPPLQDILLYRGELARCADLLAFQLGKEMLGWWKDYHNMLENIAGNSSMLVGKAAEAGPDSGKGALADSFGGLDEHRQLAEKHLMSSAELQNQSQAVAKDGPSQMQGPPRQQNFGNGPPPMYGGPNGPNQQQRFNLPGTMSPGSSPSGYSPPGPPMAMTPNGGGGRCRGMGGIIDLAGPQLGKAPHGTAYDFRSPSIVDKFKNIRDLAPYEKPPDADVEAVLDERAGAMWDDALAIRKLAMAAMEILQGLQATEVEGEDPVLQDLGEPDLVARHVNVFEVFGAVRDFAWNMVRQRSPLRSKWRSACQQVIHATRRVEEMLQPLLRVEVIAEQSDAGGPESVAFTHPTALSHPQAPIVGSATGVTWSAIEEIWTQGEAEAPDLLEENFGGETERTMQHLEHTLLELQNRHGREDCDDIAETLHSLGVASQEAGDLEQAMQHLEESLRMKRSMHGDGDHHSIAVTLHELGIVSQEAGDLEQAKQPLEESLRMKRSMHGDGDHHSIAVTLHELGIVSQEAGDLEQAKQPLEESLRMKRSMHGDGDHHSIAVTLHELGIVSQEAGDLEQAKQPLEESLRMKRSMHGDGDHHSIAVTLHELGIVSQEAGDLEQAKQPLEESLRMKRSMHGDGDHHSIAVTLHELGIVSQEAGDLEQAKQPLEESLRMKRSMHGDGDHHSIAVTLHELGIVSQEAGDLEQAKQPLEESLRMKRSMHGDGDHHSIAVTLHELGIVSQEAGDLEQAKQPLEESLRMKRSMHGDGDHHSIAVTLHELGIVSQEAGDLEQAKQPLEESLRMKRSVHGDGDHDGIAVTLHELGVVSREAGDLEQAKQHLEESLRMKRSVHGDGDHHSIAVTLHELGIVSWKAGDLEQAKQHLEESLRMKRSVHGDADLVLPAMTTLTSAVKPRRRNCAVAPRAAAGCGGAPGDGQGPGVSRADAGEQPGGPVAAAAWMLPGAAEMVPFCGEQNPKKKVKQRWGYARLHLHKFKSPPITQVHRLLGGACV